MSLYNEYVWAMKEVCELMNSSVKRLYFFYDSRNNINIWCVFFTQSLNLHNNFWLECFLCFSSLLMSALPLPHFFHSFFLVLWDITSWMRIILDVLTQLIITILGGKWNQQRLFIVGAIVLFVRRRTFLHQICKNIFVSTILRCWWVMIRALLCTEHIEKMCHNTVYVR